MNKQTLKELFELEQQLGVNEKNRFHNTEKGKELYDLMLEETEQELDADAKKYIYQLMEKKSDYKNKDLVIEKAKELYDKYSQHLMLDKNIKACALICVYEILNEPKMMFAGSGINDSHYQFWVDVKQEIKRL